MRNLTGYLKKTLFLFSIFFILFSSKPSYSAELFQVYTSFEHTLGNNIVNTKTLLQIRSDAPRVISYYTASIPLPSLQVKCTDASGSELNCTFYHRGSITDVLIDLKNSVVRPDSPLEIFLHYNTSFEEGAPYSFSSQIADTTTSSVLIRYPKEKGEPAWTSDPIDNIRINGEYMETMINRPSYKSISMIFGERVTYSFDITKVFSNSSKDSNQTFEIYVPSDTNSQLIIWEEISPTPSTTIKDQDGNYIFKYIVAPEATIDCRIRGYIQKIDSLTSKEDPKLYLTENTGYWSITNSTEFKRINTYLRRNGLEIEDGFSDISELGEPQKELFYKYVYRYVIERLSFPSDITLGLVNETRLGANALTESSNDSTPIDYADFYIAILRKYNVPSRLVIGYISNITGYSSDGFYHHWVEYYDSNKENWVTADPFLEEYFSKPIFGSSFHDHITIIRRGKTAVAPKLSFYQENDFVVKSDSGEGVDPTFETSSELRFEKFKTTDRFLKGYIYITNTGNTTINNFSIKNSNISNIAKYVDPVNNLNSQIIIPKQSAHLQINIPNEEVQGSNIFLDVSLLNTEHYEHGDLLDENIEKEIPIYVVLLSKSLSLGVFGLFAFLIYFIERRINNG